MALHPQAGLFVFAVVVLLLAVLVRRDYRRAIQERVLRRACERALKYTTHLSELGASLARAQTEAEVLQAAVVELVHALDATAGVAIVLDTDGGASIAHPIGYEPPPEPP